MEEYYNERIAHKATAGLDRIHRGIFEKNKEEHFDIIEKKVRLGVYKLTPYKEKLISKGRDKLPRIISIPTIRDKITMGILNEIITETYAAEIQLRLTQNIVEDLKEAINTQKYDYFLKVDIRGFYDNIDQNILLKKIKKRIRKKEIVDLIKKAIENVTHSGTRDIQDKNERGVPQGISISNILANIYLNDVDKSYGKSDLRYFRYVDDVLILCNEKKSKEIFKSIQRNLHKLGLEINEKKDEGQLKKGFEFLGYKYSLINIQKNKYGFTVKRNSILKLENSMLEIFAEFNRSKNRMIFLWKINLRITGFILDKRKFGWLFFFSQIDDLRVLYHLDWFINKMCDSFKIDPEIRINIKKFITAYHEIVKKRGKSSYIPNVVDFTIERKKDILNTVYGFAWGTLALLTDEQITKIFKNKIYISLKDLEKDLQFFS